MAVLKDILYKASISAVSGDTNQAVTGIAMDSREVQDGNLFVAVKGTQVDGHDYIESALDTGAASIVCEELPQHLRDGVTYITVDNSAQAMGLIAANYFGHPSKKIDVIAVTGTNGKTTTATLLFDLFRSLGYNVGLISTVNNRINEHEFAATHTTPDVIGLNKILLKMIAQGCNYCFMEASSHAIDQHRITGLKFKGAVFTNLSHDHLDYHGSFDHYLSAKKKLFDDLPAQSFALTNVDDKRGFIMLQNTKAQKVTYGIRRMADFKGKILTNSIKGLELEIDQKVVWFKLIGEFNAYNLLAAFAVGCLLGMESEELLTQLSNIGPAPGRFDRVPTKSEITAIVDYAHTPDALDKVLSAIKGFRTGQEQVITVVGCGGNRDREKRPLMANIACKYSDRVILTSDNPRDEAPESILEDMQKGINASYLSKVLSIVDRKEAIKTACSLSTENDIILVAGKGHETYQEVKGVRHDFDDKVILSEMLDLVKGEDQ